MVDSLKVKEVYNKRAKFYDYLLEKWRYQENIKDVLKKIYLDMPADGRILDIGCGTGLATGIIKMRYPGAEIVGFDYSEKMLDLYKKKFPYLRAVIGDFNKREDLIREGLFDLIISVGAVSEYGRKDKVIRNIHDVLNKNGEFVNIGNRIGLINLTTGVIWHYLPIGKRKLIEECKKAGFSRIEKISISWNNLPAVITKYVIRAVK